MSCVQTELKIAHALEHVCARGVAVWILSRMRLQIKVDSILINQQAIQAMFRFIVTLSVHNVMIHRHGLVTIL